jgi:hypothetical protein
MYHSIIGVRKLKRGDVAGRAKHHLRDDLVANADPAKTPRNVSSWGGDARSLADAIEARVAPLRKRKDAVSAIELMLTASPEWFAEHGGQGKVADLAKCATRWLKATFGAKNVAAMGVHMDETTPHIWALVTPITPDRRLAASHYCDGPEKMRALHDSWSEATKHLGLERGVKGSRANHVDVRTFYAAVDGSLAAAHRIAREMNARAKRAEQRSAEEEAAWEAGAAKRKQAIEQLQAEQKRIELLVAALSPEETTKAAKRFAALQTPSSKASSEENSPAQEGSATKNSPEPSRPRKRSSLD